MSSDLPEDITYQIGAHEVDTTPAVEEGDFIEFEFESAAVFKRLADDIYSSREAGIRELMNNAVTATLQAKEDYNIENPLIEVSAVEKGDKVTLVIQDNGIGITEAKLRHVVAVVGRSQHRDDGAKAGKFGMGFLASYKLVGSDEGGFVMYSNSRKENSEPISGVWRPGGFDASPEKELVNPLDENDQYGTRFEFSLHESISLSDVRSWVHNHSKWARVPVIYQEIQQDGSENSHDYPPTEIPDNYDSPLTLSFEHEYFNAYASPDSRGQTILLDSPLDENGGVDVNGWNVDVRLKSESGIVASGPNKGLVPVSHKEYKSLDEERKTGYIKETELEPDDICLPEPIGNREKLSKSIHFWKWIRKELTERYKKMMRKHITEYLSSDDDFGELTTKSQKAIGQWLNDNTITSEASLSRLKRSLNKLDMDAESICVEKLKRLKRLNVFFREYELSGSGPSARVTSKESRLRDILSEDNGQVYMAYTNANRRKSLLVLNHNDNNRIIGVNGTDEYDLYEKLFGWKRLKNVRISNASNYDVSEEIIEEIRRNYSRKSNAGKEPANRRVTIHYQRDSKKCNLEGKQIVNGFSENSSEPSMPVEQLIIFPSDTKRNVSDFYYLSSKYTGVAKSTNKTWEYLKDLNQVHHIDDYIENARSITLQSIEGTELSPSNSDDLEKPIVFGTVDDTTRDIYKSDKNPKHLKEGIKKQISLKEFYYIPIKKKTLEKLRPVIENRNHYILPIEFEYDMGTNLSFDESELLTFLDIPEWEGTACFDIIASEKKSSSFSKCRNLLKRYHDSGSQPVTSDGEFDSILNEKFMTCSGKLTYSEMREEGTPVFHAMKSSICEKFRKDSEFLTRVKEYVVQNASPKRNYRNNPLNHDYSSSEIVYVPITNGKYKEMYSATDENLIVVGGNSGNKYRISRIFKPYLASRLHEWENSDMYETLMRLRYRFEEVYPLIETLGQIHDLGYGPDNMPSVEEIEERL